MEKFLNKYRIPSARLENWDYGANGTYFITICTKKMYHFFGKIKNGIMEHNEAGKLAHQLWAEIPLHFPFAELGTFIIMPNHTHGIIIIDKNAAVETRFIASQEPPNTVQTRFIASQEPQKPAEEAIPAKPENKTGGITGKNNPMMQENIARIIRWYKGRCTFEIRKINPAFSWHPRFHDRIIRNAASFEKTQHYIETNPQNWNTDKFL